MKKCRFGVQKGVYLSRVGINKNFGVKTKPVFKIGVTPQSRLSSPSEPDPGPAAIGLRRAEHRSTTRDGALSGYYPPPPQSPSTARGAAWRAAGERCHPSGSHLPGTTAKLRRPGT